MPSISVNPPKTPVTEGSGDVAPATLPNVCKMPGPPAPFVPTPLPNIGQSSDNLADCTTKVLFEGKKVAIKGSYYLSKLSGDMASKSSGGGIVSASEEGKTAFGAPGSMNVKAEGKNIQLLSDAMMNNGSNPYNSGTVPGNQQSPALSGVEKMIADDLCDEFCEYLKDCKKNGTKPSSRGLEQRLANDPKWQGLGISFPPNSSIPSVIIEGTPNAAAVMARKVIDSLALEGGALRVIQIVPDVVFKQNGIVQRIFDFKFKCNKDRWRSDGEWEAYTEASGKEPVTITESTCGC